MSYRSYTRAVPATPSDTVDLPSPATGLLVGVSGTLSVQMVIAGVSTAVSLGTVPAGLIPLEGVTRVNASGTSATSITALY